MASADAGMEPQGQNDMQCPCLLMPDDVYDGTDCLATLFVHGHACSATSALPSGS